MHEELKRRFLPTADDSGVPVSISTSDLDTEQFTVYVESCRRLAAELNCFIPDPSTVDV